MQGSDNSPLKKSELLVDNCVFSSARRVQFDGRRVFNGLDKNAILSKLKAIPPLRHSQAESLESLPRVFHSCSTYPSKYHTAAGSQKTR
jgi:hypothetical protein